MGDYLRYDYEINLEIANVESSFLYFLEVSLQSDCLIHPTNKDSCTDMVANEIDPQNNYPENSTIVVPYCFQATKWESFHVSIVRDIKKFQFVLVKKKLRNVASELVKTTVGQYQDL